MLRSGVTKLARQQARVLAAARSPMPLWNIQTTAAFSSAPPPPRSSWDSLADRGLRQDHGMAQPWQAEGALDIQRVTQQAMIHELIQEQTNTIQSVVPWFLQNMPPPYFRQVPEKFRVDHIKAIAAIKDAGMDHYLNLKSTTSDGTEVITMIRAGTQPGNLLSMVKELPHTIYSEDYKALTRAQVFCTADDSMSINVFVFGGGQKQDGEDAFDGSEDLERLGSRILAYAQTIQAASQEQLMPGVKSLSSLVSPGDWSTNHPRPSPLFERESLLDYFKRCNKSYIAKTDPRRFLRQRELFELVTGTEGTAVVVEDASGDDREDTYWVNVALANTLPQQALENASRLLFLHNLDVQNAHLDLISDGDNGTVTMLRMHVAPVEGTTATDETFQILARELKRCKWLDVKTMDLIFDRYPWLGVKRGEIVTGICSLMHPIMSKENALVYSKANILETVTKERYIDHAAQIADLFLDRFNPTAGKMPAEDFEARCEQLRQAIDNDVEDATASALLLKMIEVVAHTLKTNIYMEDRYALGLRLDPRIMGEDRELPYGIVFLHGRRFNGFHTRFRDISRGGMRLVTPPTPEQFALESAHQYDECYGLAFAQQLKNKDIPEGGSKAVNLINVVGLSEAGKDFVMRKSVKAFTDTILDLIVDTEETRERIVDYYGKKEILYLGPDEQVIPDDINWIIERAAYRSYDVPAAFMSSKPRSGINHKEFGVTSEGVNVYLDVALRHALGIDPTKAEFTVKMTGGPDGDVAGNELKILFREYGENVKVVGVADHSGCAEDPDGLDHDELLRLMKASLCISHFNASKLGPQGVLHDVSTEEGIKMRNSMHNRLEADAFVPCGGRPNTIDINNYKHFLKPDGTASSPLIVEGANLFVTAEARQALFDDAGVLIVKDSSANKGGVITSSYEICSAMLLSEEKFVENKDAIVEEVLTKLRGLAKLEAELLFREYEMYSGSLPRISQVISNSINVTTDALTAALDELSEGDRESLLPLFRAHLPKTLADLSFDKVNERVPEQYIKNAIARAWLQN
ncbi:Glutamate dehydrogenase 2 [Seminavis robusta]|uniref:Glutamate dehydrogenase 2 n=1 Tax=Seminavis robusta TaxID=568900 RepID=A0A9N8DFQ9_9STRA|nr:Glutamate dehydrogenase 2 [Seminavis robusta]|eukprot:Sro70_g039050.1 Glutamate dehydrogenase 2 (1035) ;mRNA; r:97783-101560